MLSSSSDLSQVRRLEELAFAAWPALETRDVAGWRLRLSNGYTKRESKSSATSTSSFWSAIPTDPMAQPASSNSIATCGTKRSSDPSQSLIR